jgi:intracellular sulfur oxidation DsrE/DsrF family protein
MQAPLDVKASPDSEKGMYQDTSIEMLQKRGLIVLTCHTAVEEQARALVKRGFAPAGMTATQVADDILTHLIPGAVVVPAMVATLAVLQATYHYTYISPTI